MKKIFLKPSAAVAVGGVSQHALGRGCILACTGQGVYPSMHWAGGCLPRGVSAQEVSAQLGSAQGGGVCPSACWDTHPLWTPEGLSAPVHAGIHPPCGQNP